MRRILGVLLLAGLSACATPSSKNSTASAIHQEMDTMVQESLASQQSATASSPDAVNSALLPPLLLGVAKVDSKELEAKFDLVVNNTPATQVFTAIVSGTRYSMLAHPDVIGWM